MIKDRELLEKFNHEHYQRKRYSYLGVLPVKDLLEGIDSDLRIARALNYRKEKQVRY